MTGNEFKQVRTQLGLNKGQMADVLGIDRNTIRNYEDRGTDSIPQPKVMRLACSQLLADQAEAAEKPESK